MSWMKVVFGNFSEEWRPEEFRQAVSKAYQRQPKPARPVVFRNMTGLRYTVFYVSPDAATVAREALVFFKADKCEAPHLATLLPVALDDIAPTARH